MSTDGRFQVLVELQAKKPIGWNLMGVKVSYTKLGDYSHDGV
jgi:hypothetical protein